MKGEFVPWLLVGTGAFGIVGAAMDWNWFMESRKAQLWVRLFGRNGARVFYAILGAAIAVLGVLLALGVISNTR